MVNIEYLPKKSRIVLWTKAVKNNDEVEQQFYIHNNSIYCAELFQVITQLCRNHLHIYSRKKILELVAPLLCRFIIKFANYHSAIKQKILI